MCRKAEGSRKQHRGFCTDDDHSHSPLTTTTTASATTRINYHYHYHDDEDDDNDDYCSHEYAPLPVLLLYNLQLLYFSEALRYNRESKTRNTKPEA